MRRRRCSRARTIGGSHRASLWTSRDGRTSSVRVGASARCCGLLTRAAVSGIGHKIKSVNNPDLRVELVKEYVLKSFPSHTLLDYALAVEKVTTSKKDTVSVVSAPAFPRLTCVALVADLERRRMHRRVLRGLAA